MARWSRVLRALHGDPLLCRPAADIAFLDGTGHKARVGGWVTKLSDEPASTRARATGAIGEERLGRMLDGLEDEMEHCSCGQGAG